MPNDFTKRLNAAVDEQNAEAIEALVDEVSSYCFEEPQDANDVLPSEIFDGVLNAVLNPRFQGMQDSFHLLMLFEYDWARMNEFQRGRLLEALESTFPKFRDSMACHVCAELLGRFFRSANSFGVLNRLLSCSSDHALALIPLGFEGLAREATDKALQLKSVAKLKELTKHSNKDVRKEAAISLRRLSAEI